MPTVVLTRSADDNARTAPDFERLGLTVLSAPMIELRPLACDACGIRTVKRIGGGGHVLLTSSYATDLWLDLRETDFAEPAPLGYWVVGETSARLLRESDPDVPVLAVGESAGELLRNDFAGVRQVLYPCSAERRDELVDGLRGRGIEVVDLPLYTPVVPEGSADTLRSALAAAEPPLAILFFSPSAVHNFHSLLLDMPPGAIFGAIGKTTAEALREHGVTQVVVPERPSSPAFAEAVAALFGTSGN